MPLQPEPIIPLPVDPAPVDLAPMDEAAQIRAAVAVNLRRTRLARGMSLRELAAESGISKALLSQIERQVANPTVIVLGRIADALDVTFGELTRPAVVRPEVMRGVGGRDDSGARLLFAVNERRRFDVSEGMLAPGDKGVASDHGRGSVEHGYVVSGVVELTVGPDMFRLVAGDAVRFGSEVQHQYVAIGGPATLLTVVSYADD